MAPTNLGSAGASAWQAVRQLAHAVTRTVREQLQGMLGGLLHRPHAPRPLPDARPVQSGTESRGDARPGDVQGSGAASSEASPFPPAPEPELPSAYGQSRAVLVARDPWSLFVHWEVPPVRRVEVLRWLDAEGEDTRELLRLHDTTGVPVTFHDVDLAPGAERMHLQADPGRTYRAEIGIRTLRGRFVPLATSNPASTPAALPSADTGVRWVTLTDGGPPREAAVAWSGGRVSAHGTATALAAHGRSPRAGSSDAMPPGPRASDALPIR